LVVRSLSERLTTNHCFRYFAAASFEAAAFISAAARLVKIRVLGVGDADEDHLRHAAVGDEEESRRTSMFRGQLRILHNICYRTLFAGADRSTDGK